MNSKINLIDVGFADRFISPWIKNYHHLGNLFIIDPLLANSYGGDICHLNKAIFNKSGYRLFYIYRKKECSSLFKITNNVASLSNPKEDLSKYELINTINVECVRLDSVLPNIPIEYDFIKVDTQGSDANVIYSLGKYLNSFVGMQVELYHKPFYLSSILADEFHSFITSIGNWRGYQLKGGNDLFHNFLYLNLDTSKKDKLELIKRLYNPKGNSCN